MTNGDYFFLIFLGTIALTRVFLFVTKLPAPSIKGFRTRHYMYGLILILIAFFSHNLTIYAVGLGLFIDELPAILVKGPGHKEEQWNGCEAYYTPWCFAGVLIFIFLTYIFRDFISGMV